VSIHGGAMARLLATTTTEASREHDARSKRSC